MKHLTNEEKLALIQDFDNRPADMSITKWHKSKGLYPTAIYAWKKSLGNSAPAREVVYKSNGHSSEMKQMKIENQRLRLIVSDLMLDRQALMEFAGKR